MISKELLREVLGMYVTPYDITQKNNKILFTWDNSSGSANSDISICELAQLCKEWALDKSCYLKSVTYCEDGECDLWHPYGVDKFNETIKTFKADTEPNAIFKACEWILNARK